MLPEIFFDQTTTKWDTSEQSVCPFDDNEVKVGLEWYQSGITVRSQGSKWEECDIKMRSKWEDCKMESKWEKR